MNRKPPLLALRRPENDRTKKGKKKNYNKHNHQEEAVLGDSGLSIRYANGNERNNNNKDNNEIQTKGTNANNSLKPSLGLKY